MQTLRRAVGSYRLFNIASKPEDLPDNVAWGFIVASN